MERALKQPIIRDLDKKIVLVSGPRQVGKTTLSKEISPSYEYLNFDSSEDRRLILSQSWDRSKDLVIFDELHKKSKWKSWIKGIYDKEGVRPRLLVTGSARLEVYKKGGDSLAGRHFHFRLHPFSVAELQSQMDPKECLDRLLRLGGFPEPFLSDSEDFAKRWRSSHLDRILKEDLLELEQVRNLKLIEILTDLLAERVGSPVSYSSLARDLEISPHTVKKWIGILESLYVVFVVPSYSKKIARSILKEPKIYFYDVGRVKNDLAARFENTVALSLLKKIHGGQDLRGERSGLFYVRDKEKREVDFLTVIDNQIHDLVEVKVADTSLAPSLKYYTERLKPLHPVQVVHQTRRNLTSGNIAIVAAASWLCSQG